MKRLCCCYIQTLCAADGQNVRCSLALAAESGWLVGGVLGKRDLGPALAAAQVEALLEVHAPASGSCVLVLKTQMFESVYRIYHHYNLN